MEKPPRAYQRFFAELKRRRVFNTAAIYGGVAFVVFQAADFVVPALRLDDSVSTAIVVLSVVAFPFVLGFSWLFDLTREGVKPVHRPKPGELEDIVAQSVWKRWPVGIAAAVGILLLVGGVGWRLADQESPLPLTPELAGTPIGSVAVMPFLNLTTDLEATHLSEGIGLELSEALRRVPGLRVAGQASVASAGNPRVDLSLVAEELGVGALLEGSVGESQDRIEVGLRLVAGENGNQPWTRHYQLPKDSLLVFLDRIAWDLAVELGAEVPDGEVGRLVPPATANFTAYCDYLLGRQLSSQGTPEALESAIEAFHRAVLLDPGFGRAWSALAMAYVLLPESGGPPVPEIMPYAQAALDRALDPDVEGPEGFAVSGFLKWFYLWDIRGGEEAFQRSIVLDPHNPIPRYWLARALTTARRFDEARDHARAALEMDPHSPVAHLTLGMLLYCEGEEGAREAFQRGLELAPDMHPAAFLLGSLLAKEGDLEGAAREFDRFSALTGSDPGPFQAYLSALSDPEKTPAAVSALQGPTFFGPTQGAAFLAHLGEDAAAFALLERAAQDRSSYL
ncbi:MAG: tetratricopeptide repeat protein, partial [Gemmatimonadetes bacterium]|nr:tetratricopeptide repeat protein [Gemmatimonadota bacterium]